MVNVVVFAVLYVLSGAAFVLWTLKPWRGAMVQGSRFSLTDRLDTTPRLIGAGDLLQLLGEMERQGCIIEIHGSHEQDVDRNKIHVTINYHPRSTS